jgi:DNA repair exonuclease SbcCD ATPase subunit
MLHCFASSLHNSAVSDKTKRDSPLVQSVLALDHQLAELERIGGKINSTDMTADVDVDFVQKLMTRFAECGRSISEEVSNLSTHLQQAQSRAESVAQVVSKQAELFKVRRDEQMEKLEQFRALGERVRVLTEATADLRDRSNIPAFEAQLTVIIDELEKLRESARNSRMKALANNAQSLVQRLQAVLKKLRDTNR